MLLFYKTWFIVLMLIICPPFGIILMIRNSFWEKKVQVILGIISVIFFVGILVGTIALVKYVSNRDAQPIEHEQISQNKGEETNPEPTVVPTETSNPTETTPAETTPTETTPSGTNPTETTPETTPEPTETVTPVENTNPTPDETTPVEPKGRKEDYTLTESQIEELTDSERYLYLLGKEFYENNREKYNLSLKAVTNQKYDLTIEAETIKGTKISEELKIICEKIYYLGYKPKTMQIVLKIGKEIATIDDYSSEILPQINCSVFENNKIVKKIISIKVKEEGK